MIRCVVFDIDDTLYLERDYARSGFRAVEAAHRISGFGDRCWELFLAGVRGDTFNQACASSGIEPTAALLDSLVTTYREHAPEIALLPDALSCIERLAPTRRLACITDGPVASQRAKLNALGLEQWFDPIVVTGELGEGMGKPHPRPFEVVMATTGFAPEEHIYVADNPTKDMAGAAGVGWASIRIRRPDSLWFDTPSDVLELADLSELLEALR